MQAGGSDAQGSAAAGGANLPDFNALLGPAAAGLMLGGANAGLGAAAAMGLSLPPRLPPTDPQSYGGYAGGQMGAPAGGRPYGGVVLKAPLRRTSSSGGGSKQGQRKQCNCKNSRCLKLYCECFASGRYCDNCNCNNCFNNSENEQTRQAAVDAVLERNPNAFRPKIQGDADRTVIGGVRHTKGCNCKKSGCLKKYCECFQAGIFCSRICKCQDCKNYEGSEARAATGVGTEPQAAQGSAAKRSRTQLAANIGTGAGGSMLLQARTAAGMGAAAQRGGTFRTGTPTGAPSPGSSSWLTAGMTPAGMGGMGGAQAASPAMLQQAALSQAAAVNSIVGDVLKDEFLEQLCKLMLVVAQEQVDKAAGSSHAPAANGPAAAAASAAQDGVEGAAADPQQQQEAAAAAAAAGAAADAGQQMDMDGQQQQPSEPGSAAAAGASSSTPAAAVGAGGLSAEEAHAGAEAAVLQELHLVLEKINATIGRKTQAASSMPAQSLMMSGGAPALLIGSSPAGLQAGLGDASYQLAGGYMAAGGQQLPAGLAALAQMPLGMQALLQGSPAAGASFGINLAQLQAAAAGGMYGLGTAGAEGMSEQDMSAYAAAAGMEGLQAQFAAGMAAMGAGEQLQQQQQQQSEQEQLAQQQQMMMAAAAAGQEPMTVEQVMQLQRAIASMPGGQMG